MRCLRTHGSAGAFCYTDLPLITNVFHVLSGEPRLRFPGDGRGTHRQHKGAGVGPLVLSRTAWWLGTECFTD